MPLDLIRRRRSGSPAKAKLGGQVAARCFALRLLPPRLASRRWPGSPDPTAMREESFACGCLKTQERNPHRASYPFPSSGGVEVLVQEGSSPALKKKAIVDLLSRLVD